MRTKTLLFLLVFFIECVKKNERKALLFVFLIDCNTLPSNRFFCSQNMIFLLAFYLLMIPCSSMQTTMQTD